MNKVNAGPCSGSIDARLSAGNLCNVDESDDLDVAVIVTEGGDRILVDADDVDYLARFTWFVDNGGYAYTNEIDDTPISMHRLLLGLSKGDGRIGDHRNGITLDNRRANLRVADASENACNRATPRHSLTGLKGVRAAGKRWAARIKHRGVRFELGTFDTPEEAHRAYCKAADAIHGEFANHGLRVPSEFGRPAKPPRNPGIRAFREQAPQRVPEVIEFEPGETIESFIGRYVEATLRHFGGHQAAAAQALGISKKTLYNMIQSGRTVSVKTEDLMKEASA